ncbi:helix-turn-helix transcriptional regulator [Streptomyces sp. A3M-1-3]|nr:helix-turn-helix transcriptional regulator [Streptomyces sp. A3M-1-3]
MLAAAVERARGAVAQGAWNEAYALLRGLPVADLAPEDLEALADAAWWTCHPEESLAVRLKAYAGYAAAGDGRRAGYTAWMVFYDYQDTGRTVAAAGWLRRARRHLGREPECVEQCLLAWSDSDAALGRGAFDEALAEARRMTALGQRFGSPDMVAMGLQVQAGVLVAAGRTAEGLTLLDDTMCSVMAGELSELFTGWVYCLALQQCMAAAQLERAAQWTEAAMDWCASLPAGNPFRGQCRVHRVEVLDLRGAWTPAVHEAEVARRELLASDPQMAGEAWYVSGEIHRRRGDLAAAEAAFARAHELGWDPQPGLALIGLVRGETASPTAALRVALAGAGRDRLGRCRLLAAQVEVALAAGDNVLAREAADELDAVAQEWPPADAALLYAMAATAGGAVALAEHDIDGALSLLLRARSLWLGLEVPYEAAQTRMLLAAADREAGDHDDARLELAAAGAAFERLGAVPDARRAAALMADGRHRLPGRLTGREAEVLRLVAAGLTNRAIAAELVISEHTVSRHLNNIFAKLDVPSRAAATAYAFRHGLA